MGKKKPSKPVEKEEVAPELVDPARLNHGEPEGDIAASYSADKICDGKPIRKPFPWRGGLWVCTSSGPADRHEAYRLVPLAASAVVPTTYSERVHGNDDFGERARRDPNGFYHGVTVQHAGQSYVMTGPKVIFMAGDVGQSALFAPAEHVDRAGSMPPIAGSADREREARLDAARVTLEYRQQSNKRLDNGKAPIGESPLFGGAAQGSLFDEEA